MLMNFKYKSNEYLLKLSNSISFKKIEKKSRKQIRDFIII